MTTIRAYIAEMQQRQYQIGLALGCDLSKTDKTTRIVNMATLAMIATVMKTLVDQGVITDAQLLATLNAALAENFPDLPIDG